MQDRWTDKDELAFEACHAAGLPEEEIIYFLRHLERRIVKEKFAQKLKESPILTMADRLYLRKMIEEGIPLIVGPRFKKGSPEYCMAMIMTSALFVGRNVEEIARITILPRMYVERIFSRLDIEEIWRVDQRALPDLSAAHYLQITRICLEERALLRKYPYHAFET